MPELSKVVDKRFYRHPRALKARISNPGSIALWLFANCFCRDHRKQGELTREEALFLGSQAEIDALVEAGLWEVTVTGYRFHDWLQWNPDFVGPGPVSSAARIVYEVLPDHPDEVRFLLAKQVEKLINEGANKPVIESALLKWQSRPDARVSWLPHFVSDAIREGGSGIEAAIKQARDTWDMRPLAEYGFRWEKPDAPPRIGAEKVREFMRQKKTEWLDEIEAGIRSGPTTQ